MSPPAPSPSKPAPLDVAIIGGGICGAALAVGLSRHQQAGLMTARLYEQSPTASELGFGFGLNRAARRALELLDPRVPEAFRAAGMPMPPSDVQERDAGGVLQVDGYHEYKVLGDGRPTSGDLWPLLRNALHRTLLGLVLPGVVQTGKKLVGLAESASGDGRVQLEFLDGEKTTADFVIGCDGLRSRVRSFVLPGDLATQHAPRFTHFVAARAVVPLDDATAAALESATPGVSHRNVFQLQGPRAHLVQFRLPGSRLGLSLYTWHTAWPDSGRTQGTTRKADLVAAFSSWHPNVRRVVELIPHADGEGIGTWAVFDMAERPLPMYARGAVALAGDAAHATSPFHGHGAGMGIVDALCLSVLLEQVAKTMGAGSSDISPRKAGRAAVVEQALQTYDRIRRPRTQWVVESSRWFGEACMNKPWDDKVFSEQNAEDIVAEIRDRFAKVERYDVDGMVESGKMEL